MRTDSADVRPNARLISIKRRIRAVSARVARGEPSRARRGARNLWKFCKWPKSLGRSAGAASAARYSAGPSLPLSPIDGAEKFLRKKDPRQKNLGVKFFPQPGEHHPCRPSAFYALWQSILPQQCLFGTKLPMISTLLEMVEEGVQHKQCREPVPPRGGTLPLGSAIGQKCCMTRDCYLRT